MFFALRGRAFGTGRVTMNIFDYFHSENRQYIEKAGRKTM